MTVKELIEKLKTYDPDAYVGAYSEYEEADLMVRDVFEAHLRYVKKYDYYGTEEYNVYGDSMVAEELKDGKKVIVLSEYKMDNN
jgi:hypothetical protein